MAPSREATPYDLHSSIASTVHVQGTSTKNHLHSSADVVREVYELIQDTCLKVCNVHVILYFIFSRGQSSSFRGLPKLSRSLLPHIRSIYRFFHSKFQSPAIVLQDYHVTCTFVAVISPSH